MKSDILLQSYIFLVFILNGLLIGLIFDFFRTLRKSFNTTDIMTYVEDVLFWIISGGITLYLIFNFNNGELRAYIFIGLVIGIILYTILLSKIFMKFNIFFISIIKKSICTIFYPIIKLINLITKIIKELNIFFQKSSKNIKNINNYIKKVFKIRKKEGKSVKM